MGGAASTEVGGDESAGKMGETPSNSPDNSMNNVELILTRFEGLKQLMEQSGCKDAFNRFLCCEKYSEDILVKLTTGFDVSLMTAEMEEFIAELIKSLNVTLTEDVRYKRSLGSIMCNPSMLPATLMGIVLSLSPKFLKSPQYKKMKETGSIKKMHSLNEKRQELVHTALVSPAELKIAQKAIASVDLSELDRLLQSGSWLTTMLAAVENLPVCVSLASARKDRPGFPLIYVNACFERTTGYKRNEIVGHNCRFLQAGKAEPESIERMSNALKEARPIKVAITNYRKDGMPFKNLLAMKPIFSETGEYEFVVGVQFDVTQEDATPDKLKLADQVIKMLPNVIVVDKKGEESEKLW